MNITQKIEDRIAENKSSVKTYASHQFAEARAEKVAGQCLNHYCDGIGFEMQYLIIFLPHVKRWTVVFNLSSFLRANKAGGYIGAIADLGFFTI